MKKLIIIDDDGSKSEYENVLDFDVVDVDDIQSIAGEYNVELDDNQLNIAARKCSNLEYFPNSDDLREIIREIINGEVD